MCRGFLAVLHTSRPVRGIRALPNSFLNWAMHSGVPRHTSASSVSEKTASTNLSDEYRRLAARGNYVSQDRGDGLFASKELAKGMKEPLLAMENGGESSSAEPALGTGEIDDELAAYMPYIEALTRYYAKVRPPLTPIIVC